MHNHRKMQRPREEEYNNSIHVVQQLKLLPRRRRQKQELQSRCAAGGTSLARSFSDPPPSPAKRCKTRNQKPKKPTPQKRPTQNAKSTAKPFFFFFAGGPMHLAAVIAYIRAGALAYYFGCIRMNMIFLIHVLYFRVSMMFLDERDIYHLHT